MTGKAVRLTTAILVCAAALSAGCARAKTQQIKVLSEQEAADLWSRVESHEPVGEAVVRRTQGETGTTVITTQAYALRMKGGGSGGAATVCGFSCVLTPGSGFPDCKTSGCVPSGNSCTPASCSGGCTQSQPCRVEASFGFGGVLMARLDRPSAPASR